MRVAVLAITKGGKKLQKNICQKLSFECIETHPEGIKKTFKNIWPEYDAIVAIMATGIIIRAIAPLLQDKFKDPCVIALDEAGQFSISLLSGHIGGGNALAVKIAALKGNKVEEDRVEETEEEEGASA